MLLANVWEEAVFSQAFGRCGRGRELLLMFNNQRLSRHIRQTDYGHCDFCWLDRRMLRVRHPCSRQKEPRWVRRDRRFKRQCPFARKILQSGERRRPAKTLQDAAKFFYKRPEPGRLFPPTWLAAQPSASSSRTSMTPLRPRLSSEHRKPSLHLEIRAAGGGTWAKVSAAFDHGPADINAAGSN